MNKNLLLAIGGWVYTFAVIVISLHIGEANILLAGFLGVVVGTVTWNLINRRLTNRDWELRKALLQMLGILASENMDGLVKFHVPEDDGDIYWLACAHCKTVIGPDHYDIQQSIEHNEVRFPHTHGCSIPLARGQMILLGMRLNLPKKVAKIPPATPDQQEHCILCDQPSENLDLTLTCQDHENYRLYERLSESYIDSLN